MLSKLRSLRESRGWSRAELARRAGLNQVTVGAIESGRLLPYQSQVLKLEEALGVRLGSTDLRIGMGRNRRQWRAPASR